MKNLLFNPLSVFCLTLFCSFQVAKAQDEKPAAQNHIKIMVIDKDGKKHVIDEKFNGEMSDKLKKRVKLLEHKTNSNISIKMSEGKHAKVINKTSGDFKVLEEHLIKKHKDGKHKHIEIIKDFNEKLGSKVKHKVWVSRQKTDKDGKLHQITIDIDTDDHQMLLHDSDKWIHNKDGKTMEFHFDTKEGTTNEFTTKDGKTVKIVMHSLVRILEHTEQGKQATKEAGTEMRKSDNFKGLSQLNVYPNPNEGKFNLQFNLAEQGNTKVAIYDMKGNVVYNEDLPGFKGNYNKAIDLSQQSRGMYIIRISQNDKTITRKVNIQ